MNTKGVNNAKDILEENYDFADYQEDLDILRKELFEIYQQDSNKILS